MKLPIYAYGNPVLKQKSKKVQKDFSKLSVLINNMWETMDNAQGCGLAAPQVGKLLQLFVVDSKILYNDMTDSQIDTFFKEGDTGIREVFINAEIINFSTDKWRETEGCLSLPYLSDKITRSWTIEIKYQNQDFKTIQKKFSGMTARVIQHEYDHTQGVLYTDHSKSLSKKLMEGKLKKISKGKVITPYTMKFNNS